MGMIGDFVNSMVNSLTNMMKDAVGSALTCASNLLADGLTSTTTTTDASGNSSGIIANFIYASPFEWKAGAEDEVNGVSIWHTLGAICDSAVVPLGAFIMALVLIYELVSMVEQSNSFRQMDTSIFVRWTLKFICGVLFVSNIWTIVKSIFAIGTSFTKLAGDRYISSVRDFGQESISVPSGYNFGQYLILLLLSGILIISIMILICVIVVVLCSRMLECFMYIGIAPVTSATLWSQDWKDIGFNWLKNILALALQGLFIIFAIGIFSVLMQNVINTINSGGSVYMKMAILLGYTVSMIFTMLRTSNISKSIFNAH